MTHAVAEVVLVEQFRVFAGGDGWPYIVCPDPGCDCIHVDDVEFYTLGDMLTAARRHISDAHPGGDPLGREHAYTVALHAVDAINSDAYPALITEADLAADETTAAMRVCEATGNSVRGPLLPYEADGVRRWICRVCFARRRRNASHVADPLPLPDGAP